MGESTIGTCLINAFCFTRQFYSVYINDYIADSNYIFRKMEIEVNMFPYQYSKSRCTFKKYIQILSWALPRPGSDFMVLLSDIV